MLRHKAIEWQLWFKESVNLTVLKPSVPAGRKDRQELDRWK